MRFQLAERPRRFPRGGDKRYRVEYRLGGREAPTRYGGSFKMRREASLRNSWIAGELAALRVPHLRLLGGRKAEGPDAR
jgi:hypothetical protein